MIDKYLQEALLTAFVGEAIIREERARDLAATAGLDFLHNAAVLYAEAQTLREAYRIAERAIEAEASATT